MKLAIVGIGHVGLVTGAALVRVGHEVVGVDGDVTKVEALRNGGLPFHEEDLQELVAEGTAAGRLRFTSRVGEAVPGAEVVFICVGRPPTSSGDPSLIAVEAAARDVARHADHGVVIAEKSTVPPGTADRIRRTVTLERPDLDFDVVANPEFLREGHAVEDTLRPDRIVVGADSERGFGAMRRLYAPLTGGSGPQLIETDVPTAELAKLACNAFLATKISFANAIARVAEVAGADVLGIAEVMGSDPRIGRAFLGAGLGFGGYCLPKDLLALERLSARLGYDFGLLREVDRINREAVEAAASKIEAAIWNLEDKRVALLGLAFKPETDDVRAAPALALARRLIDAGATVVGYDPLAGGVAKAELPQLELAPDPYAAAERAHCLILATDWPEFRDLDWERVRSAMVYPIVVDGRNALDQRTMVKHGFSYHAMGRATDTGSPPTGSSPNRHDASP
jgi:UDPglucose 6-dehydrogenase